MKQALRAAGIWACLGLRVCGGGGPEGGPEHPAQVFALVWRDEFDGAALDEAVWEYRTSTRYDSGSRKPVSVCLPRNVSLEGGHLTIRMKVEDHHGVPNTAGGVITRQRYKYGYYEVSARMDGRDQGWHEAFWSAIGGNWPWPKEVGGKPWFEMDAFEHFAHAGSNTYSYGLIEWSPRKGSVSRETLETDLDLGASFNRYGMEYAPDYFAFYFNDVLLQVTDISRVGHADMRLWLSAVSVRSGDVKGDGVCAFDYLRCYAIDPASDAYLRRRGAMLERMRRDAADADAGAASRGTDLWIDACRFAEPGAWTVEVSPGRTRLVGGRLERSPGSTVLRGREGARGVAAWSAKVARTQVTVPQRGRWHVWVRAKDFAADAQGRRFFQVAVNGRLFEQRLGTHGGEGFAWQRAGELDLEAGRVSLELVDSSGFWARAERLLLTTDAAYVPSGPGNSENVTHGMDAARLGT